MCRNATADELGGVDATYKVWHFLTRYLAPVAILFVLLRAVGMLG